MDGFEQSASDLTFPLNEEEEPHNEVVKSIWRSKMLQSALFSPSEVDQVLHVWLEFIQKILQHNSTPSAKEFYMSTATECARQLRYHSEDGWRCLIKEYPPKVLKCTEEQDPSVSSEESSCDVHRQVEFLLQLVSSSNVRLHLVRLALDKTFSPNFNFAKSADQFRLPRTYWESNLESVKQEEIRRQMIYGECDGYILPLHLANEADTRSTTDNE